MFLKKITHPFVRNTSAGPVSAIIEANDTNIDQIRL